MTEFIPQCMDEVAYFREFNAKARARRIPVSGSLALTNRCNLRCVHCYVRAPAGRARRDLPAAWWKRLIDQAVDAGCLFLLMTGGEPLVRRDFARLYTHAREKGTVVSLFTNGTLIDADTVKLFKDLPPRVVDITLYGASEETYRRVTGVRGAYARCRRALDLLIENGIQVSLKTVLLTLNRHEFSAIQHISTEFGIRFRLDGSVFPRYSGDREPLRYRLQPSEIAQIEFGDDRRARLWAAFARSQSGQVRGSRLFVCGAGGSSFHVSAEGVLQPCVMASGIGYSLTGGDFEEGWRRIRVAVSRARMPAGLECRTCERKALCGYCPPFSRMETGSAKRPSEFLCELGKARAREMALAMRKGSS